MVQAAGRVLVLHQTHNKLYSSHETVTLHHIFIYFYHFVSFPGSLNGVPGLVTFNHAIFNHATVNH